MNFSITPGIDIDADILPSGIIGPSVSADIALLTLSIVIFKTINMRFFVFFSVLCMLLGVVASYQGNEAHGLARRDGELFKVLEKISN